MLLSDIKLQNKELKNDLQMSQIYETKFWDLDALYKFYKNNIDSKDINQVLKSLYNPLFYIKDKNKFDYLWIMNICQ